MKKSDFKNLSKDSLIELLLKLSKLNKENETFLESKLSSNYDDLFKLYCEKIDKAFCCYELMSLRDARRALLDFKKSNPSNSLFIQLCLYYIKKAYELEKTDWRFQENFYSAIERVYDMIFDIFEKDLSNKEKYIDEIEKLIEKSNEGWYHKEYLEYRLEKIK